MTPFVVHLTQSSCRGNLLRRDAFPPRCRVSRRVYDPVGVRLCVTTNVRSKSETGTAGPSTRPQRMRVDGLAHKPAPAAMPLQKAPSHPGGRFEALKGRTNLPVDLEDFFGSKLDVYCDAFRGACLRFRGDRLHKPALPRLAAHFDKCRRSGICQVRVIDQFVMGDIHEI